MEQLRVVWCKPLWQRITIAVVAIGLDVGMLALIASGSAGAWQPWFFLGVFTIGLASWWLPKTVLDDVAITSRSVIGLTRRMPLAAIAEVGYGPLGVWIDGRDCASGTDPATSAGPAMILHAVQGVRPLGGVANNQQGGPSGQEAVALISARATRAGASVTDVANGPGVPSNAGSLWSRLR